MRKSRFGPNDGAGSLGQERREEPGGASKAGRMFVTLTGEIFKRQANVFDDDSLTPAGL